MKSIKNFISIMLLTMFILPTLSSISHSLSLEMDGSEIFAGVVKKGNWSLQDDADDLIVEPTFIRSGANGGGCDGLTTAELYNAAGALIKSFSAHDRANIKLTAAASPAETNFIVTSSSKSLEYDVDVASFGVGSKIIYRLSGNCKVFSGQFTAFGGTETVRILASGSGRVAAEFPFKVLP